MFAWRSLCLCGDPLGGHTRGNIASGNSFRQQCFLVYDMPFLRCFSVSCFRTLFPANRQRSIPRKQFPVTSGQRGEWIIIHTTCVTCL